MRIKGRKRNDTDVYYMNTVEADDNGRPRMRGRISVAGRVFIATFTLIENEFGDQYGTLTVELPPQGSDNTALKFIQKPLNDEKTKKVPVRAQRHH